MNKIIVLLFFSVCIFFLSCEDESLELATEHVLIVYMAADNDLSSDAVLNLKQIKKGYIETGNKLLVFMDTNNDYPQLLEITSNKTSIVKGYPEMNSAASETLNTVLSDIIALYPCSHYGLILWSHGTSWLPSESYLRSFGEDQGRQMNIPELAESLPVYFDFILFDACLMGSIEVAYELREKTKYILASSTETLTNGFPYQSIVPELLKSKYSLEKVAQNYFNYYNSQKGDFRSATISLIDTQELNMLAYETKELFRQKEIDFHSFNRYAVQRLDVYEEQYHFDLLDFINQAFPGLNRSAFISQLNKAVIYKAHTPNFLGSYDIKQYCGLSCYIPLSSRNDLNNYYKTLQWNFDCSILP